MSLHAYMTISATTNDAPSARPFVADATAPGSSRILVDIGGCGLTLSLQTAEMLADCLIAACAVLRDAQEREAGA